MLEEVSEAARIAEVGEAITAEELALAARNHGMPLEAMRYDVTPAGLHYLLTHYDIPVVDPSYLAAGGGRRGARAARAGPRGPARTTGRDRPGDHGVRRERPGEPRATADQPALAGRGGRDGRLDRRPAAPGAGSGRSRSVGGRRGLHRGRSRDRAGGGTGLSTQPAARGCVGAGRPARVRDERGGPAAAARLPAAVDRAGLVRDGPRQVALPDRRGQRRPSRFPAVRRLSRPAVAPRGRRSGDAHPPAGSGDATWIPRLHVAAPRGPAGSRDAGGARLVWGFPVERVDVSVDDGPIGPRRRSSRSGGTVGLAALDLRVGGEPRSAPDHGPRRHQGRRGRSPPIRPGAAAASATTPPNESRSSASVRNLGDDVDEQPIRRARLEPDPDR